MMFKWFEYPFIDTWCNGSTTDFGSVCPGSNPDISTNAPIYANWSDSHPLKVEIRVRVSLGVQKIFQIYLYI